MKSFYFILMVFIVTLGSLPEATHAEDNITKSSGVPNLRPNSAPTLVPASVKEQYTCPMHPAVRSDHPGECPICHMKLDPVKKPFSKQKTEGAPSERKIKFYRNPMDPSVHSQTPAKDSMGMDYIPVYERGEVSKREKTDDVPNHSDIQLSPEQLKLSGTRSVSVERGDLSRELWIPGRSLGGGQISFQVFEQELGQIQPGLSVEAEVASLPGEQFKGKITSTESILDPMTRTARVNATLSLPQGKLIRAESSVSGNVKIKRSQVLSVPESAVLYAGARNLVYVTDGEGNFSPRVVKLGVRGQGRIEIRDGLQEGEKVSTGANFLIDSESRIQASTSNESPNEPKKEN